MRQLIWLRAGEAEVEAPKAAPGEVAVRKGEANVDKSKLTGVLTAALLVAVTEGEVRTGNAFGGEGRAAAGESAEVSSEAPESQPVYREELCFPEGEKVVAEGIFRSLKGFFLDLGDDRGPVIQLDLRIKDEDAKQLDGKVIEATGVWRPAKHVPQPAGAQSSGHFPPQITVESYKLIGERPPKWLGSVRRFESISWGQAVNGLQDRLEAEKHTVAPGEDIKLTSPSGIGGASVALKKGRWPKQITVRLALALDNLEFFGAECGGRKLTGRLGGGGKDALAAEKKGEFIEVALPAGFASGEKAVLRLSWIDAYR